MREIDALTEKISEISPHGNTSSQFKKLNLPQDHTSSVVKPETRMTFWCEGWMIKLSYPMPECKVKNYEIALELMHYIYLTVNHNLFRHRWLIYVCHLIVCPCWCLPGYSYYGSTKSESFANFLHASSGLVIKLLYLGQASPAVSRMPGCIDNSHWLVTLERLTVDTIAWDLCTIRDGGWV